MSGLRISQRAALLIGESAHAGRLRVPHQQLIAALDRAALAARKLGVKSYLIKVDAIAFLVRNNTVVTLVPSHISVARAAVLSDQRGQPA